MKPFLFVRGQRNYARFLIPKHYRHLSDGKQYLVFALGAAEPHIIRKRVVDLETLLLKRISEGASMTIRKFNIVTPNGTRIENINTQSDVDNLMKMAKVDNLSDLLEQIGKLSTPFPAALSGASPQTPLSENHLADAQSILLIDLLDKFFLLKKVKPATVTAYKNVVKEFTTFCKSKCPIASIMVSDVTRYREFLANKNNPRTIDNKMIVLKSLMNFAINNGYLIGKNPVVVKNLQTKKQKTSEGYEIFEVDEIQKYFHSDRFKQEKENDPDYYWCLMLEIFTGCRVGELTSLQVNQIKKTNTGIHYLRIIDSKTVAGKREIPLPELIFNLGFNDFIANKPSTEYVFKYLDREGKGAGNAVSKKFTYHIKAEKIHRPKLVFHSLRKFLNDFYMKNAVQYELRCQYFGHEIESVNVSVYTKVFNTDELFEGTNTARKKLIQLIGF